MDLREIWDRIKTNVGDPRGRTWTDVQLLPFINEAQQEVATLAERVDPSIVSTKDATLAATGAGADAEVALPLDFRRVLSFIRTSPAPAREVTRVDVDRIGYYRGAGIGEVAYLRHDPASTGILSKEGGRNYAGFLDLASAISYTWTLYYAARLAPFNAWARPTQVPRLPEEWHHLIPLRATVLALVSSNQDARQFTGLYDNSVAAMMASLPRRDGQPAGVAI